MSLATALEERAEPGTILCSAATARLIQDAARLEAMGPVQVPGQPAGAEVYQVLGRRFRRSPGERHRGRVLSPFVGRDRELATLHALLAQVEEGRGQVVGVVGEAGLGKSRLVYEFTRSLGRRRLAIVLDAVFPTRVRCRTCRYSTWAPLWHHRYRWS